ncbi:MAG: Starvation sensing protein RspA, partial [uncultured Thermomicrobiales bacterium]
ADHRAETIPGLRGGTTRRPGENRDRVRAVRRRGGDPGLLAARGRRPPRRSCPLGRGPGRAPDRVPLAAMLPAALLPWRPGDRLRPQRYRPGPLGSGRQGARRAGPPTPRRPGARPAPLLCPPGRRDGRGGGRERDPRRRARGDRRPLLGGTGDRRHGDPRSPRGGRPDRRADAGDPRGGRAGCRPAGRVPRAVRPALGDRDLRARRPLPPLLRRGSDPPRVPRRTRSGARPGPRAARDGRARARQVGYAGVGREGFGRLSAPGCLQLRRDHRATQNRRAGRGPPYQPRAAQRRRADRVRRRDPPRLRHPECRHDRGTVGRARRRAGPGRAKSARRGRLHPPTGGSRAGRRFRRGGRRGGHLRALDPPRHPRARRVGARVV